MKRISIAFFLFCARIKIITQQHTIPYFTRVLYCYDKQNMNRCSLFQAMKEVCVVFASAAFGCRKDIFNVEELLRFSMWKMIIKTYNSRVINFQE